MTVLVGNTVHVCYYNITIHHFQETHMMIVLTFKMQF